MRFIKILMIVLFFYSCKDPFTPSKSEDPVPPVFEENVSRKSQDLSVFADTNLEQLNAENKCSAIREFLSTYVQNYIPDYTVTGTTECKFEPKSESNPAELLTYEFQLKMENDTINATVLYEPPYSSIYIKRASNVLETDVWRIKATFEEWLGEDN